MKVLSAAALFVLLLISQADAASGYALLNAGIAARGRDDPDAAIGFLTQSIAAPDLPQNLLAVAYFDRAEMYAEKEQYDLALADTTAGLKLRSDDYEALVLHAPRQLHLYIAYGDKMMCVTPAEAK